MAKNQELIKVLTKIMHPARGIPNDYDPLIEKIGDAEIVLIGEASHGTHEFYQARADITKRLITEKGFEAVAIEGDWPAAYKVNEYVLNHKGILDAQEALSDFKRFPSWMWRNTIVHEFISWLKNYNQSREEKTQASFIGLDLYSLHHSIEVVLDYLASVDPLAAEKARERYSCFDHFGKDLQQYGYFAALQPHLSCKSLVLAQLTDLRKHTFDYLNKNSAALDRFFNAEQNARLIKNAEHYYRSLFEGNEASSWNVRDHHMMETLETYVNHLKTVGRAGKIIVWAHNSHLGDARATEMSTRGEVNLGQLVRQEYGNAAFLIGFTTYSGTVSAASDWGAEVERKHVRSALNDSYEDLLHQTNRKHFLFFTNDPSLPEEWHVQERLERAIGVIYRPQTERMSHYFFAILPQQFDAVIHIDKTQALQPLDVTSQWVEGEIPDTYPTGE